MAKRSLLLVDGDAKSLRVLEVSLKKAGFNVTTAMSGRDALTRVRSAQPDLVISDTDLEEEMDGYAFCREFKANPEWAEIPFVFLTGQTAIEHKIKGLELGVDDYLTKPIYIKEILTRVRILLQKRDRANFEQKKDHNTRFAGRLNDMGVVDLIQTIEVSRKTGVIHFRADEKRQATLFFKDGKVIDAEAGHLQGEDAVYRLLTWSDGEFEALFRPVRRKPVIEMSAQGLLMEGMRRLDEWGRLQEQLPPLTQRFEVVYDELWDRLSDLPDDLNQILRLFDSRRTLAEVIDGANTGDLEAVEIISKLYFEGIIVEAGSGQGTPSGTFPVEALLRKRKPKVAPDLEDTVPEQALPIETPDSAAQEDSGPLESDEEDTDVSAKAPDPEFLTTMLDKAITEAEPIAAEDSDPGRSTNKGFPVAQLKIAKKTTSKEQQLAENLLRHGSEAKGAATPVAEASEGVPLALSEDEEVSREIVELQSVPAVPAEVPVPLALVEDEVEEEAARAADEESASDYEVEAEYPDEDDAPQRPYVEDVQVVGVISSDGAVNKAVSGSLAVTELPIPSKMPKPGYEDEDDEEAGAELGNIPTSPGKRLSGDKAVAKISSYDEEASEEQGSGSSKWLVVGAVAALVMGIVIVTAGDKSKKSARAAENDASVAAPIPSIGTPLLPATLDAGSAAIVAAKADAAPKVATSSPPDAALVAVVKPDARVRTVVPSPPEDDPEARVKELINASRRAERNQDRIEALQLIDEALEIRKSSTALAVKADLLMSLGDSAAALGVAKELTRVAPRRAQGWRIQGTAQYEQKDYKGARASFTRYLELAPSARDAGDVRALIESM